MSYGSDAVFKPHLLVLNGLPLLSSHLGDLSDGDAWVLLLYLFTGLIQPDEVSRLRTLGLVAVLLFLWFALPGLLRYCFCFGFGLREEEGTHGLNIPLSFDKSFCLLFFHIMSSFFII